MNIAAMPSVRARHNLQPFGFAQGRSAICNLQLQLEGSPDGYLAHF